jgi:leucyl aminopeptidase
MADLLERRQFKGEPGDSLVIERLGQTPSTVVLVGLGDPESHDAANLRTAGAGSRRGGRQGRRPPAGVVDALGATGSRGRRRGHGRILSSGDLHDQRFRSEPEPPTPPEVVALLGLPPSASEGLARLEAICGGVELARQLVAAPPNVATPQHLADTAAAMAGEFGLEYKLLERSDCEALGMGALPRGGPGFGPAAQVHPSHLPAQRSSEAPGGAGGEGSDVRLRRLQPQGGGLPDRNDEIRHGRQRRRARSRPCHRPLPPRGVETHVIVASCENMISGGAIHPGDILTASNGKTIEINNTDAEGRLTLADALVYACGLEPDAIVDLATLTGACVIALGNEIAGLWSSSDALADGLLAAGRREGSLSGACPFGPPTRLD